MAQKLFSHQLKPTIYITYATFSVSPKYLSDYDKKNAFDIERFLSTRLKPKSDEVYDVYEVDVETDGAE